MSNRISDNRIPSSDGLSISPFLRWPGGKRWLTPILREELQGYISSSRKYFEPFLGGGALFFGMAEIPSLLADINFDLVNVYIQVRDNPNKLIKELKKLQVTKENYYKLRDTCFKSSLSMAVRFLFLNRTSFSGLYRINREGKFNVPFGGGDRTHEVLWRDGLIVKASRALQRAEVICADFEETISMAKERDIVYCDPTYTVKHNNNGFRRYNERVFSWNDQERLAQSCRLAVKRGALVLVSNAYHEEVRRLYPSFRTRLVKRLSRLSAKPQFRCWADEYLLIGSPNY